MGYSLNSCPSTSCPQQSPQSRCCCSRTPSLQDRKAAAASCAPHTSTGHWDHPHHTRQLHSCRLKHVHGCTEESQAPQADQPAMAGIQVGEMKRSSIARDAMGGGLHLPGSADTQPAPEEPPLDHLTELTSGGAGSKWHWDHFSAMYKSQ